MIDDDDVPVEFPIDGILDLHTFRPEDVKGLVPEYINACKKRGILHLRIIHGKGHGVLRTIVHSILAKHPLVKSYRLDPEPGGSWGATLVDLKGR